MIKKRNIKSQMEILGLAIVVVLVLMTTIFLVSFVVLKTPIDYRKGFISSEIASNMLNTLLKTNAEDCKQLTMTELLQDCAQGAELVCGNNKNSCDFVRLVASEIFKNTLKEWNMNYEFIAYTENNKPFIGLGESCKAEKRSKLYPIPIKAGTMYAKLDICN